MMKRFPPRPIRDPGHISLLVPTRARPTQLHTLFTSIQACTADRRRVAAWIYVDDDDAATLAYRDSAAARQFDFDIHWEVGERIGAQGQMCNLLWQRATGGSGIYLSLPDDYVVSTSGWDDRVRAAFDRYPDRIALVYPDEATAALGQVTIVILSAEWLNLTGRLLTAHFPYWYDDTWLDQVAQMVQRKQRVAVELNPQGNKGKTIRMRNLLFWGSYFDNLLGERLEEAERLRAAIYGPDTPAYAASREQGLKIAGNFRFRPEKIDYAALTYVERTLSGGEQKGPATPRYLASETAAVENLFAQASEHWQAGQPAEALLPLINIGFAERRFSGVELARAACLAALGRLAEARMACQAELEIDPANQPATRLLAALDHPAALPGTLITLGWERLHPEARGENTAVTQRQSNAIEKLRIALLPVTLRLDTLRHILIDHAPREWFPRLADLIRRVIRRRLS